MAKPHIIVVGAATVSYMVYFSKEGSSSRIIFMLSSWLNDEVIKPNL